MKLRLALAFLTAGVLLAQQPAAQPLTLEQAEQLALQKNPRLSASQYLARAVGSAPSEIRSIYQPTVSGSITGVGADSGSRLAAGGLNNPVVYNHLGTGLTVSQFVTDFGRTRSLVESAKLRAQAQDQVTVFTKTDILLQVDRAYFEVLRSRAVLGVARQTVASRQVISDQVTALANSQLKSTLDVSFANVNLQEARLLLSSAQNDLDAAVANLATAMGTPGATNFTLAAAPMPPTLSSTVEPLIDQAIQRRPELANLRLQQNAAERFVQAEKALKYPNIGVLATAGFVPTGEAQVPGRYGAAGVNVTIPVFNGGLFRARRTEAEYRSQAASQDVKDEENRVVRDVRIAYLGATTGFERLGLTSQLLQQAQLAFDLAKTRYDLGISSIVELSQAQLNLTSAQIATESAKYEYQSERSVLDFQVGARQ